MYKIEKYFRSTSTDVVVDESSSRTNEDNSTEGYGNLFENRNYAIKSHSWVDEPCMSIVVLRITYRSNTTSYEIKDK